MARRWGLGPVFVYEWRIASRRWQMYVGRVGFIALLLLALYFVWQAQAPRRPITLRGAEADTGEDFYYAIVGTQLALVLLAAPGATAGALCHDKARGALMPLLLTDLSDSEIILGKLAARLLPVLGLLVCGAPVLFLALLLGGIDPDALITALLVTLGVAVVGCALALTLSVWGSRAYEVLLATYMAWTVVLLAAPTWWALARTLTIGPSPHVLDCANPFWLAFAHYTDPGTTGWTEPLVFLAVCLGLAAVLVAVSVARVRAVTVRHAGRLPQARSAAPDPRPRRWWRLERPGPFLDRNPILWREWHRRRPSPWVRLVWRLYAVSALGFSLLAVSLLFLRGGNYELVSIVNAFEVSLGLLLLSVSSVTTLADERAHGGLDVLLATPLPTFTIVWGKWWSTYRTVPWLAVLPGLSAFAMGTTDTVAGLTGLPGRGILLRPDAPWLGASLVVALILAYGAAITSFGMATATWVRRPGHAIAVSVSVYVLITVGWCFIVFTLSGMTTNDMALFLMEASPFYGVGVTTSRIESPNQNYTLAFAAAMLWSLVYLAAAVALLVAILVTFNRCLGRGSSWGPPRSYAVN